MESATENCGVDQVDGLEFNNLIRAECGPPRLQLKTYKGKLKAQSQNDQ